MQSFALRTLLCALFLLMVCAPALAKQQELPEVTEDGLHRVPDSRMAIVYAKPGADLSGYQSIQLLDAYVAFKKNWERDQRSSSADPLRLSSKDIEKIKSNLAQELHAGPRSDHLPGFRAFLLVAAGDDRHDDDKGHDPKHDPEKPERAHNLSPTGSRPVRNLVSDDRTEYKRGSLVGSDTLPSLHGIVCGYAKNS